MNMPAGLIHAVRAALAALVRSQKLAAAGTALYRNQCIETLPAELPRRLRPRPRRRARFCAVPIAPLCPLLPPLHDAR